MRETGRMNLRILTAATVLTLCLSACSQTTPDNWIAYRTNTIFNAALFPSPQAAVSAAEAAGGGTVFFPCGTYIGTIRITTSGVTLRGANRNCAILQQPSPDVDELTIDATSAGTNGLNYNQVQDLTLRAAQCIRIAGSCGSQASGNTRDLVGDRSDPATLPNSTGSGLVFVGILPQFQPNDWNYFLNLTITGFYNGIDIRGRTIWTKFDHVQSIFSLNNGLNVATSAVVNTVSFYDSQFAWSQKYGIYWNTSSAPTLSQIINFIQTNVQNNQLSGSSTTNCAAAYFSGINTASFQNSEFESDCPHATDGNATEVLLTGKYAEAFNFFGVTFNSIINYDLINNALQTSGFVYGNTFLNWTTNSMKTAITGQEALVEIGANLGNNPVYILDVSGNDHVIDHASNKQALYAMGSVENNTISVLGRSYIELYYGPYTLETMTGGFPGQTVTLEARVGGGITIMNGSSPGGFLTPSGQPIKIPLNGKMSFIFGSDAMWHPESPVTLAGISETIGGSPLKAGQCASGSVNIEGAQPGMAGTAAASDGSYQAGFTVQALGTANNTATVNVCAIIDGTPFAKTYNVRLLQ